MSHRRQGNRLKQRIGLTAQLVIGEDDDLIQWWENIESGTGNTALKTLLRAALNLPIPQPDADAIQQLEADTSAAFETVSAELDTARQQRAALEIEMQRIQTITANLPTLIKQIAPKPTASAPAVDTAEIDSMKEQIAALMQQIAALSEQNLAFMTWANEIHGIIHNGAAQSTPADDVQPVNTDPAPTVENGLTEAEQADRAKRLRRSKW